MQGQSAFLEKLVEWLNWIWDQAMGWLTSPAARSQFALLAAAYIAALLLTRRLIPAIEPFLTPKPGTAGTIATARRFALRFLPLILPLLAYGLTAVGVRADPRRLRLGRGHRLRQAGVPVPCRPRIGAQR